jgi:hypothetical protein
MFAATPLLGLPVLIYNLFVFSLAGAFQAPDANARLSLPLFSLRTAAGAVWPVSTGDLIVAGSLLVLFIELLKSTASRRAAIVNHALSVLLFVICLVELLLAPAFASSTFCLITLMVLLDVLAGFFITIAQARREADVIDDRY